MSFSIVVDTVGEHCEPQENTNEKRMGIGNGDGEESMSRVQMFTSYAGTVIMEIVSRQAV